MNICGRYTGGSNRLDHVPLEPFLEGITVILNIYRGASLIRKPPPPSDPPGTLGIGLLGECVVLWERYPCTKYRLNICIVGSNRLRAGGAFPRGNDSIAEHVLNTSLKWPVGSYALS